MDAIGYLVHVMVYWFICMCISGMPALLILRLIGWLGPMPSSVLGVPLLLAWLLGCGWLSHNAARRRVVALEGFWKAFENAFGEGRSYLENLLFGLRLLRRRRRTDSRYDEPKAHH